MSGLQNRPRSVPGQGQESCHPTVLREGPSFSSLIFRSPLSLVLLCALTFIAALFLLEGTGQAFWRTRDTWLWHLIFAFQPVLYVTSIAVVFKDFKAGNSSVWPGTCGARLAVVLCTALVVALIALPVVFTRATQSPLHVQLDAITQMPDSVMKWVVLVTLATAVSALHLCGLFGAHIQLIGWLPEYLGQDEEPGPQNLDEDVRRYLRLRSQLQRFLGILAGINCVVILNAGSWSSLLEARSHVRAELAPPSFIIAYGLYFTALLACCYLPAHNTLTKVGDLLANRLVRQSISARTTWKEWSDEQQAVRTYLGLQGSALQELQQSIAVLSPFIASISTLALVGRG